MTPSSWEDTVIDAALSIAGAADERQSRGSTTEGMGELLIALGKAAGHCDQLHLTGPDGRTARDHFRRHLRDAGAEALLLLAAEQGRPDGDTGANRRVTEEIARRFAVPATDSEDAAPAVGRGAGAVGGALVAIGQRELDRHGQGRTALDCERVLELVIANAITGMAHVSLDRPVERA